jgi:hypothetical protein
MAHETEYFSSLDLPFEPDVIAEDELADEDEEINNRLISDETIRQCRLLISLRSAEYGIVSSSPGVLFFFSFDFHPFEARFKNARIRLRFESESEVVVMALQPDCVLDTEGETIVQSKLSGRFRIGYFPFEIAAMGESTRTRKHAMQINGSGVDSDAAVWTLQENRDQKQGIPRNLIAAVALQARGEISIDLDIRAKLGSVSAFLPGIRKIIIQKSIRLDGRTAMGSRPEGAVLNESTFCSNR